MKFSNTLLSKVNQLSDRFNEISLERKEKLKSLSDAIMSILKKNGRVDINVICTHNSRRSHLGQLWIRAAALYYDIDRVFTYSGGTEATSLHPNMAEAMRRAGFLISSDSNNDNPNYNIKLSLTDSGELHFSKTFDHQSNPSEGFLALIVCDSADKKCPFVPGANRRVFIPYEDPKHSDGSLDEKQTYDHAIDTMGKEILYTFDCIKNVNRSI